MTHIKTHYETMKVDRQAPLVVIRAAYKALCQLEHPDRNPGPEAENRMAHINAAYAVLRDPARRAEHDKWIAEQERLQTLQQATGPSNHKPQEPIATEPPPLTAADYWDMLLKRVHAHPLPSFLLLLLTLAVIVTMVMSLSETTPIDNIVTIPALNCVASEAQSGIAPVARPHLTLHKKQDHLTSNTRPPTAPNGSPWPTTSGLISGYPVRADDGLSTITVDNVSNPEPLYLKLVQMPNERVVRQLYIAENDRYTITNIDAGQYILRYKTLNSPASFDTDSLLLEQNHDGYSTQFSKVSIELKIPPLQ